jgi:hypothetical protein
MMQTESKQQVWSARVQEQAASGLGIRAWCVREGLTEATFHYWRKRLSVPAQSAASLIAFPLVGRPAKTALELQTPHGYVIRIASDEQLGWVKGLLEVLR